MAQDELRSGFEQLLGKIYGTPHRVLKFDEQSRGDQGASGAEVKYFEVASENGAGLRQVDTLVTKAAWLKERRIVHLLESQECAVPPVYIPDMVSEERAPIFMPYLEARPAIDMGHPQSPITLSVADGLAKIHAANRKRPPSWLPHTSEDFVHSLWLYAWQERWQENLADPDFAAEFGAYTPQLEAAMERLMRTLDMLTAETESLTLLNVDLHPGHIRLWRGSARFIDWEQASYGTLYLDLPNYITIETALVYRDALAQHGYEIPVIEFLERYHEVGRYMGLRYLGYSLWRWAQGGEERKAGRWFLYYTFALALHGR